MEKTLDTLTEVVNGELIGDGRTVIRGVNVFDSVQRGELTFAEDQRHLAHALTSDAAAIIVSKGVYNLEGRAGIRVDNPKLAFVLLLELFHPDGLPAQGVHPTAVLGKHVQLGDGVSIQANAVIGDDVAIGRGTMIGAGVSIGKGVAIGELCMLHPNVVVYRRTQIGDRVRIHGGTVIGGDGFGYIFHQGRHVKIPQVGNVVIEDDVEIGCNVCVDRATVGSTVIRQGTKIDNLVQIAHNNHIGKHVVLAGQVGLSGSVTVGDYTIMGGKAGVTDHLTIGQQAKIGAASVVVKSVPSGETVWGFPAQKAQVTLRQVAAGHRLPSALRAIAKLLSRMRNTETRLARLEERLP